MGVANGGGNGGWQMPCQWTIYSTAHFPFHMPDMRCDSNTPAGTWAKWVGCAVPVFVMPSCDSALYSKQKPSARNAPQHVRGTSILSGSSNSNTEQLQLLKQQHKLMVLVTCCKPHPRAHGSVWSSEIKGCDVMSVCMF